MKSKIIIITMACLAIVLLCLFIGPVFISPLSPFTGDELNSSILFNIRLPRLLVAIVAGASLGASGVILQGILRNPLADPYVLGISSGAALMAVIAFTMPVLIITSMTVPVLSFIGAMCASLIVAGLGQRRGVLWPERLLLAGVGLGFLLSAVVLLFLSLAEDQGLKRALLWLFGDLSLTDYSVLGYSVLIAAIGLIIAVFKTKALNALMLGDELAFSLGFNPTRARLVLFIASSLLTAASVSIAGVIGFIGLIVPHIVRMALGADTKVVLPLSMILGATLLCVADTIGRTIISPTELPSGIITALIGAPYFLYLLKRKGTFGER